MEGYGFVVIDVGLVESGGGEGEFERDVSACALFATAFEGTSDGLGRL